MCAAISSETRRHFEIAFKMYDVDGSDFIDQEEFSRVRWILVNICYSISVRGMDIMYVYITLGWKECHGTEGQCCMFTLWGREGGREGGEEEEGGREGVAKCFFFRSLSRRGWPGALSQSISLATEEIRNFTREIFSSKQPSVMWPLINVVSMRHLWFQLLLYCDMWGM